MNVLLAEGILGTTAPYWTVLRAPAVGDLDGAGRDPTGLQALRFDGPWPRKIAGSTLNLPIATV